MAGWAGGSPQPYGKPAEGKVAENSRRQISSSSRFHITAFQFRPAKHQDDWGNFLHRDMARYLYGNFKFRMNTLRRSQHELFVHD